MSLRFSSDSNFMKSMNNEKTNYSSTNYLSPISILFIILVIIFISYIVWYYYFRSNVVYDSNPPMNDTTNSNNYSVPGNTLKMDVTIPIHALEAPTNGSLYSQYYLPPGKTNGQVLTFLLNGNGENVPQNLSIWIDNCKTVNGILESSVWYPFSYTYTVDGNTTYLNQGSIVRAIWYNNYWYLSTNTVNQNS